MLTSQKPHFEAANWVETEMLVKFPDEHWISLTQAGSSVCPDLMKIMEKMGKIEEHGDNLMMERQNLFFGLLLSGIHSGNFHIKMAVSCAIPKAKGTKYPCSINVKPVCPC